jgi:hypothetical protein
MPLEFCRFALQVRNHLMNDLKIEHLPLDRLIPYAKNSRTHSDEQVAQIAAVLMAEAVRVLPGWENSRGARLEVAVAEAIGIEVQPA